MKTKLCDDAIHCGCSDKYEKAYNFIRYIANDYFELSQEKVRIQRDDYVRIARKLLKELNDVE